MFSRKLTTSIAIGTAAVAAGALEPARIARIHDEPAGTGGNESGAGVP